MIAKPDEVSAAQLLNRYGVAVNSKRWDGGNFTRSAAEMIQANRCFNSGQ